MTAREISESIALEFLRRGNYALSSGPVDFGYEGRAVGAAVNIADDFDRASPFSGLSVQSVGYEDGNVNEPAVHIYLTRGNARETRALPSAIDGIPVHVHKMGAITVRPDIAAGSTNRGNYYERSGRVCCGSSCAPTSELSTGTLGGLVTVDQKMYLLSNNHVLAGCNHVPADQPVLAPSSSDGRADIAAPREIGRHDRIHELRSGEPTFVEPVEIDAALAKATNLDIISSWQGDAQSGYDTPSRVGSPESETVVKKFGRTTGLTRGVVESHVTTPTPILYNAKHFKGTVWFKNIWIVRSFDSSPLALPGDSGSLVVKDDETEAVGLLFAASRTGDYAWIIPLDNVLSAFPNSKLVSGYGC